MRREVMREMDLFMTVDDVAKELGISKSYAYKVVQRLNEELKAKGYLTISGRVNRTFFMEKYCYEGRKKKWQFTRITIQTHGVLFTAIPIGTVSGSRRRNAAFRQSARRRRGNASSFAKQALRWT